MKAVKPAKLAPVLLVALLLLTAGARRNGATATNGAAASRAIDAPAAKFASKDPGYTDWCLEWSKDAYVGGYQRAGQKDPKWDQPALNALEACAYDEVFHKVMPGKSPDYFQEQLKEAMAAGCTDPLIRHLMTRRGRPELSAYREAAAEYGREADEIKASGYPTYIKFLASLRAGLAFRAASTTQLPEVATYRKQASAEVLTMLRHEEIPAFQAGIAVMAAAKAFHPNAALRQSFYTNAEQILSARWPNEGILHLFRGKHLINAAEDARGIGPMDTVTSDGERKFEELLDEAEPELNKAWELDPSLPWTPLVFMDLELYQGRGRARMEMWFERALAFPQNQEDAVAIKLFYIDPRWHGSEAQRLTYAREVVKSDRFTGMTPLCLYYTHEALAGLYRNSRPNYWTEPQVWPDVKASFERCLALNGGDDRVRQWYITAAVRCNQWRTVNEQIGLLSRVDYGYFGGQGEFETLKRTAADKASKDN